jgi:hypothetical protein
MKRCLSAGNVDIVSSDQSDIFVTKKPRRNKKSLNQGNDQICASQPCTSQSDSIDSIALDNVINSVAHVSGPAQSSNEQQEKQINDLKQVVIRQSAIINTVVSRLNFLLSMFNIDEVSVPSTPLDAAISDGINLPITHCSNNNITVQSATGVNINSQNKPSYSSVAARNTQTEQSKQLAKLRQSMVAAVYVDQRDKDRRSTSFIVSGLPTASNCPDKKLVTDLCLHEFNLHVGISSTKRLGKTSSPSSSSSTKIQPLLVSVQNPDHAKLIISSARQLRQSVVPVIRDNVFINANLTRAEASAAYELRCRRRDSVARRTVSEDYAASLTAASGDTTVLPGSSAVTASFLSAAVPSFVPSTRSQINGQNAVGLPAQHSSTFDRH